MSVSSNVAAAGADTLYIHLTSDTGVCEPGFETLSSHVIRSTIIV